MIMTKPRPHVLAGLALALLVAAAAQGAVIRLKVTAELANIRLKPSISSVIIRQIKEGAILEATRKDGEFYLVKLDPDEAGRTEGYVHESLVLALDDNAPAEKMQRIVERAEPPKPKPIDETPPAHTETRPPVRTETRPAETRQTEPAQKPTAVSDQGRMSLFFSAGGIYSSIGDLNNGTQGLADLYAYQLGIPADKAAGTLHFAFQYGGEINFPLARQFFLCAGLEYYGSTSQTIISYPQGLSASTLKVTPEFRAIPIKIGFVFYPADFLYFKIGAAYAFARAAYAYRFDQGAFWQDWSGEATGGALGFFGAIGLDLKITQTFSVIVEAAGQSLSISGLTGTGTFQDSTLSAPVTETGKLYSYNGQITPVNIYPLVFLRSKTPSEGGVANAREAVLDLSGLALKAGIKISF
jgi:hypothetical protein